MTRSASRSGSRRSYHHGDLRAALLRSATAILKQRGVDALSLREVARGAGVSHAAPYHHFADRADILAAVASEGFRALRQAMIRAAARAGAAPRSRLAAIGRAYVKFALAHPAQFRLMFSGQLDKRRHPELVDTGRAAFDALLHEVRAARGDVAGTDASLAAAIAGWSMSHGLAMLWLDGPIQTIGEHRLTIAALTDRIGELAAAIAG